MKRFVNFNFICGLALTSIISVLCIWGLIGTPYDAEKMDPTLKLAAPSFTHIMGCDQFGRDVFSRVLEGAGNTFLVAMGTILIGVIFGIIIGGFCGYYGGPVDEIIMRANDAVLAFPGVFLALVVISVIGSGKYNVIIALGIAFIPSFARMVRSEFMKQKDRDYVTNARLMKVPAIRTMFVHILPNCVPVLLSSMVIGFNNAVLAEAGLSYLGIGVQPPDASLGAMLSEAQTYLYSAPHLAIFPGVIMVIMILGLSLLSDGITAANKSSK